MNSTPKARILIVDDVPGNIKALLPHLTGKYEVLATTSGQTAIDVSLNRSPDIILLDIVMPDMDGFEVCRQLKGNPQTASIPIIFLSGNDQEEDENRAFEMGAADYLKKPINHSQLSSHIHSHLKSHQQLLNLKNRIREQNQWIEIIRTITQETDKQDIKALQSLVDTILTKPLP
ncbi:response regulator [Magnetococcales bacterium HHB-1]